MYVEAGGKVHNDDAAEVLGISRRRVVDAQPKLREALLGTGIELRRGSWSQTALRPAGELVGANEMRRLNQAQLARRGLRLEDARRLRELRDGLIDREWEKRVGVSKRGRLGRLLDIGLAAEPDPGTFALADDVRFQSHVRRIAIAVCVATNARLLPGRGCCPCSACCDQGGNQRASASPSLAPPPLGELHRGTPFTARVRSRRTGRDVACLWCKTRAILRA